MTIVTVLIGSTQTINTSGDDAVTFLGAGTLNVTGTAAAPIAVNLTQLAGVGALDTVNLQNAHVTLSGVAGAAALVAFNVGTGSRLDLGSALNVAVGSTITFAGPNSVLGLGNALALGVLSGIAGFGPGSAIDVGQMTASLTYADNPGANTGGVLTLRDAGGNPIGSVPLTTGDFTASSFALTPDATGGTYVSFPTVVTGIAASPTDASLTTGGQAVITLATSAPVTITGGTPTLGLNDGGTAIYNPAASTPTSLVFTTTVAAGQNTPDLAVTGVNLNGATVADGIGIAASLTGAVANPAGILAVDTTAPTITGVTTNPGSGNLTTGATISLTVTPSEPVAIAGGIPTLSLSDGGIATYNPAASTSTSLVFTTTVAAGQNTPDLTVTGISLNGAAITDPAGNAATLTGAITNPAGILAVDTTPPTITGVTTTPGSGNLTTGATIGLTVTTSEPVTVAGGTPTLSLNDGGIATYNPVASTPTSLAFTTTVAAGQNTPDLAVTGVSLNGATITDPAGNAASLTGAVTNPPGILAVDTTPPTITGVTTNPGSGNLTTGATIGLIVTTSEPVTVAGGTPTLSLSDGGIATYNPTASTPTSLVFTTTVAAGQNTPDLAVTGINLNGAAITDPAGNAASLTGAITNPAGILAVDTTAPIITGVTTTPGSGNLTTGSTIGLTVTTSEPVTVAGGTPTLSLSDGGIATYNPAASTPTSLMFTTTVAAGQNTPDLAVTGISLNGAAITDPAGNAATLTGAVTNPAGILAVDTTPPTITGVTTSPGSGNLTTGATIGLTVTTSEPVTVAGGIPTLGLSDGGTATYNPAASTSTSLVFTTTVAPGQNTPDLAVTGISLNGATITDPAGNTASLSGAVTNPPGILAVDTTAPTVTGVTTSPGGGTVTAGTPIGLTVTTSQPVTIAGGTPTLSLSNGATATYNPTASTPTALAFTYTPTPGDDVADLAVTGLNLNGGSITNATGTAAILTGAITNPPGVLTVSTAINPFTPITVSGADTTGTITVSVATRPGISGTYGTLGTGSIGADGVTYTVAGTIAQVNAALAAVTLTPARGSSGVAGFTASVTDANPASTTTLANGSGFGSILAPLSSTDAVRAGTGTDTLLGGTAANAILVGGPGNDVLVGSTAGGTLLGGTGSTTFFSEGGGTVIVGHGQQDVVATIAGSPTVFSAMGGHTLIGLGTQAAVVTASGTDTVIGGGGTLLAALNGATIAFGGAGASTYLAGDGSTVIGGSGSSLVGVTNTGTLFFAGTGPTTFIGGTGSSTVIGGVGAGNHLFAGSGGGVFAGGSGGGNILVGGQQGTTLFGGGGGDVLFATGSAGTVLVAGAGNETLQGGGSTGADTFFLGSGTTLVGLGTGSDAVFGGSGAGTVVGGSGADIYAFTKGQAGGTEAIIGFKSGIDKLSLQGYGANEAVMAAASVTTSQGGGTTPPSSTITLSDNTRITFLGSASLPGKVFG